MSHPARIPPRLASVRGPVLFPGDDGFAGEAAVFNTTVAHNPYVIVGGTDVADVRLAIRFAREGMDSEQTARGEAGVTWGQTSRLTRLDGRKHPGYLSPADAAVESVRLAYDEATYERLRTAKTERDPRNMFRWNYNIPPRA
ncbi:BBE domain-containing protein [Micromonospora sp. NPDC050417]|uniref:BBE domain-containing protein n=1 Tax=Micromonospora sp. NPDC050417 TaxID=3364280 RepID=UPI0037B59812